MGEKRMPVIFVGHGTPMNAIEDNQYTQTWEKLGKELPRPEAIVCISAHWETDGPEVTAMERPKTIHDFDGFPRALFDKEYSAPGDPSLAINICSTAKPVTLRPNLNWGLDHGSWSVLCRMYPNADIPVVQISLDRTRDGSYHYNLGRSLRYLRETGVLVIGSGNIVHNLMKMSWGGYPYDWAVEVDNKISEYIRNGDHDPLIQYQKLGTGIGYAINSGEHYLPLLYILAMQREDESAEFFNETIIAGSISMRGVIFGRS